MSQHVEVVLQDDVPSDDGCILGGQPQVRKYLCFPFMYLGGYGVCLGKPYTALIMIVLEKQESTEHFQEEEERPVDIGCYAFDEIVHDYIRKAKLWMFLSATPVPFATLCKGSSATWNSMLILSVSRFARPRSRAPPPVSQMPFFTMSA